MLGQEPVPLRQFNAEVPRDLETIALKCLEKEPRRRYGSAQEVADELQRYLDGKPVLARPVGTVGRLWRWCRRKPALAAAGILAGIATIAAIVILSVAVVLVSNSRNEALDLANKNDVLAGEEKAARLKETEERQRADAEKQRAQDARVKETEQRQRAEKELLRSEGLLYASQIASAQREWETNNVGSARRYLGACRKDLRGWEYDYLYTLFNKNQKTLKGHTFEVVSVAFSPDGKRIVSGGGGLDFANAVTVPPATKGGARETTARAIGEIKVWDAASGRETLTLKGLTDRVMSVAFSPDGKRIVSGGWDRTLKVWDATSGRETLTLKGHNGLVYERGLQPRREADRQRQRTTRR